MNKGSNFEQPRVIQAAREGWPCCQQEIPADMKLISKIIYSIMILLITLPSDSSCIGKVKETREVNHN